MKYLCFFFFFPFSPWEHGIESTEQCSLETLPTSFASYGLFSDEGEARLRL